MIEYSYLPTEKEIENALLRVQMSGHRLIIYFAFMPLINSFIMDKQGAFSYWEYALSLSAVILAGFFAIFMAFKYRFYNVANNLLELASANDSMKFDLENRLIITNSQLVYATESFGLFNAYKIFDDKIFLMRKNIKFSIIFKKGFKNDEDFQKVVEAIKTSGMKSM